MTASETIVELLRNGADNTPAILAPGRPPLDYAGLRSLVDSTVVQLNELGIGRNDTVAIVLPNGPEMATAFFTVAQVATTAPLNPAYKEDEYAFYLDDLSAKALIVAKDDEGPATRAADGLGIPLIGLAFDASDPAGVTNARPNSAVPPPPEIFPPCTSPPRSCIITCWP